MGKSKRKQLARKQLSKTKKKTSDPFSRAKNPNPYASSGVGGNRFDIKDNLKAKHSVLGRKVKGRSRDVARARTLRRDEHESTLRPAIQNAHKVNTFVDKRLGEDDETLDQDDRDLKRFIKVQKDRFRTTGGHGGSGKTNKFNLVGGEEDDAMGGLTLTHAGQAVDDLDFSGHHGSDDDEREEDEQLGGNVVERLHFGSGSTTGGDQHGEVTKTREEIYKELIAKSKMYKAQRQQQKAVDGQEQESLDAEMDELRSMLDFRPKGKSKKEEEFEAMMERAGLNKDGDPVGDAGSGEGTARSVPAGLFKGLTSKERRQGLGSMGNTSEHDEFDIMARSLLFEARAQASDRTKTPEEKAKDEYEKMKEKEEERKKRARGDFINDNDDVDDEAYHEEVANRSSSGSGSSSSSSSGGVGGGDSLSANFAIDDEFDHTTREKEDDDAALLDNEGNETMDTATAYSSSRAGMRALKEREESEMPYVVKCPLTMSDFSTMVNKWTTDENNSKEIIVLIERIIKNHSVHLPSAATAKMSNRDKMSR
jgi:nucleolar protein 14